MIYDNNPDYYRRREQRERDLAARAASPEIAKIHLQLADHYVERLQSQPRPKLTVAY